MKSCTKCGVSQSFDNFSKNRNMVDGLQRQCKSCSSKNNADYYLRNAEKIRARNDTWALANIEKVKTAERAYSQKPHKKERDRVYREENKEVLRARQAKWRADNPGGERLKATRWAIANRGVKAAGVVRYRVKKQQRTADWADLSIIDWVYKYCAYLNEPLKGAFHVDHIYPLRGELVSGLHVVENLQILGRRQNSSKGNRLPPDGYDLTPVFETPEFLTWLSQRITL